MVMKNFANLSIEILSNEELMSVRGGDAPVDPIIIKPSSSYTLSSSSTITTTTTTTTTTTK
jgi:hypothetical protein